MKSQKVNKIKIDAETYGTLKLIKNGVLSNFTSLMDDTQIDETISTGYLNGEYMPYAYIFSPSGEKNQTIIKNSALGDRIILKKDGLEVGEILVTSSFKNRKYWNYFSIFNADALGGSKDLGDESSKSGEFCLSGEVVIYDDDIKTQKDEILKLKNELNLQKITALMLQANPFHRVHERLIRLTIDKADFVLLFLIKSAKEDILSFDLRLKTLEYFAKNFLKTSIVKIIPIKDTMIFSEHKNPELECIAARNFGASKVVLGQNHGAIGMFYDENQAYTIIDKLRSKFGIEILVMPEYVYCSECKTIVSLKACPHGQHRHIRYHSGAIRTLLGSGILPPTILMRKEISALILSELFPKRFENLQLIYDELFPNSGILESHTYKDFYEELANLYQTSSLT